MNRIEKYLSILQNTEAELSFKKSRFIACLIPVKTEEEFQDQLLQLRSRYPKATHYCYAVLCNNENNFTKMSDDGEPSGTAGRPILDVLRGSGLMDVMLVVIRYFGGTLLGTGGLVRAYSETAKEAIHKAQKVWMQPAVLLQASLDYSYYNQFESKCRMKLIGNTDIEFLEQVEIKMHVPLEEKENFIRQLEEITARTVHIEEIASIYIPLSA